MNHEIRAFRALIVCLMQYMPYSPCFCRTAGVILIRGRVPSLPRSQHKISSAGQWNTPPAMLDSYITRGQNYCQSVGAFL